MARRPSQDLDWEGLFRAWRGSGLTQPEFCRQCGIPLHTFRRRLYQPKARDGTWDESRATVAPRPEAEPPARPASPRFLPVRVVADDGPARSPQGRPVEVVLAGGRRILVPPDFDTETLLRVVTLLEPGQC